MLITTAITIESFAIPASSILDTQYTYALIYLQAYAKSSNLPGAFSRHW